MVILTRIRPQPSNDIRESGRRQVVSDLIQRTQAKWSLKQLFPISSYRTPLQESPRGLSVVTYKDNQCGLLDWLQEKLFHESAMLLTLVYEGKPHFGKPEVEHRVPH